MPEQHEAVLHVVVQAMAAKGATSESYREGILEVLTTAAFLKLAGDDEVQAMVAASTVLSLVAAVGVTGNAYRDTDTTRSVEDLDIWKRVGALAKEFADRSEEEGDHA